MRASVSAAAVLAMTLLGASACEDSERRDPERLSEGAQLVDERCGRCHRLSAIEIPGKSRGEWSRIVDDMIDRGARLDDDERLVVIDYLVSLEE